MKIKEVIVVEGTSDKQFLETFIDADFLICNGSAVDGFDKEYLREIAKTRGIIIFTDPDSPGKKIRDEVASMVDSAKHAFVRKEVSIKHHKVGVAESTKEEVLYALKNVITLDQNVNGTLEASDLFELGIIGENSKKTKEKICNSFHLGYCNSKTMLRRLNMLNISKQQLLEVIKSD